VITPLHSNAVILTYALNTGSLEFDGAVPITGATARINISIFTFYHSLNFFGRSANIAVSLPYAVGNLNGTVFGAEAHAYRSGLLDSFYRFSVNLKGGPAMPLDQFRKWRQKILIGASLKVVAPSGQYNPTKLINLGNISYNQFYPGLQMQSETPVGAFEGHLSYDVKPRLWISLDGNFWFGGETTVNGITNLHTEQRNSRIGVTASIPITKHQSLKIAYNNGAYINYGGNYQNVSVAWQYSWIGWPK
jgi:hypothetical protein